MTTSRAGIFSRKGPDLVDLLLILNDREANLGMVKNIGHLLGDRVGIDRYGNGADRLGGGEAPIKAGTVRADYRDLVAALQSKFLKPIASARISAICSDHVQLCQMP